MRDNEREPIPTNPPAARTAVARTEPPTNAATARVEEAQIAIGIIDGFVHGNNPYQTHSFNVFVREFLADEAGNFGVWLGKFPLVGFGTNFLRGAIVVLEEHAFENGDLGSDI